MGMLMSQKGGCRETLLALFITHPEYLMYLGDGSRLKNEKFVFPRGTGSMELFRCLMPFEVSDLRGFSWR